MSDTTFKKLAIAAKKSASLDQLKYFRAKTASRLVVAQKSGLFPADFISRIESSIREYDDIIAEREQNLALSAKRAMLKTAAAAGL